MFKFWDAVGSPRYNGPKQKVTVGVYIDLDELKQLAMDAAKNKSRHAKDGALHVEVHSIQPA